MKKIKDMKFHDMSEKIVNILMQKTQNPDPNFFRLSLSYYFCKVASSMRCTIQTHDRGNIPINLYVINLANSGHGKTMSTNIIEEDVIGEFREVFTEKTFPDISEKSLYSLAIKRSNKKNTDQEVELEAVLEEFKEAGELPFGFDSGTTPAFKQVRHKCLMAKAGSLSLEIDEAGSNLLGNVELLNTFLETFDKGLVKSKLIKNTKENRRTEDILGKVPTNMLLFGTPSKLLNASKVEDEFYAMLQTGFARRCLFGLSNESVERACLTPSEVYDMVTDKSSSIYLKAVSKVFGNLADISHFNKKLTMTKDVALLIIEYRLLCEKAANELPDHLDLKKAELAHRYFKALKLAGAYAFIDISSEITEDHFYSAIKQIEESGLSFEKILNRDKNYVKLAKYISTIDREITHIDLVEDVSCYKGSVAQKKDMMTLAIAYGYRNNIIIKVSQIDGIEFIEGTTIKETDPSKCIISYSQDIVTGYVNSKVAFDQLHRLTQKSDYHWCTHQFTPKDTSSLGYRHTNNAIPEFNLVAIDCDDDIDLDIAKLLLKDYSYLIHTTKRHSETHHRFRIIFLLSHVLNLNPEDHKAFMDNFYTWLPFLCDTATKDIARKWNTYSGKYWYNHADTIDALMFIPKTKKADQYQAVLKKQHNLSHIERWFINDQSIKGRNNKLLRYGYMLLDSGYALEIIKDKLFNLNKRFPTPLDEVEILSTIMISITKKVK